MYVCYFTYFSQYTELKSKQKMVTKLQHNVVKWLTLLPGLLENTDGDLNLVVMFYDNQLTTKDQ